MWEAWPSPGALTAARTAASSTYSLPAGTRLACIPVGLVLTFFGYAVLRPAVVAGAALQAGAVGLLHWGVAGGAACCACVGCACARAVYYGPPPALGAALGAAVALSLAAGRGAGEGSWFAAGMMVWVFACAFALVFALVPEEVAIYVTAYGGSFLIWHGLALVDTDMESPRLLPSLVSVKSVDMWFNILSFLLVGLIGVCTQIILLRNQRYPPDPTYDYSEIP